MFFSIIIPVYNNNVDLLNNAIQSVMQQTFQEFEIVLVNDGATNEDIVIFMRKVSEMANVLYIESSQNQGISAARQLGLEKSHGEWICFLDCDDYYRENYLQLFYDEIKKNKQIDVVTAGFEIVNETGDVISSYPKSFENSCSVYYKSYGTCAIWNRAFRKEFLVENKIFFPYQCLTEDMTFLAQVNAKTKRIAFVNEYTYFNYCNQNSTSRARKFTKLEIEQMPLDCIRCIIEDFDSKDYCNEQIHSFYGMVFEQLTVLSCLLSRNIDDKKKVKEIILKIVEIEEIIPELKNHVKEWNKGIERSKVEMKWIEKFLCYFKNVKLRQKVHYLLNRFLRELI